MQTVQDAAKGLELLAGGSVPVVGLYRAGASSDKGDVVLSLPELHQVLLAVLQIETAKQTNGAVWGAVGQSKCCWEGESDGACRAAGIEFLHQDWDVSHGSCILQSAAGVSGAALRQLLKLIALAVMVSFGFPLAAVIWGSSELCPHGAGGVPMALIPAAPACTVARALASAYFSHRTMD